MKINRAYRVEIDPNNRQRTALVRPLGIGRNWPL